MPGGSCIALPIRVHLVRAVPAFESATSASLLVECPNLLPTSLQPPEAYRPAVSPDLTSPPLCLYCRCRGVPHHPRPSMSPSCRPRWLLHRSVSLHESLDSPPQRHSMVVMMMIMIIIITLTMMMMTTMMMQPGGTGPWLGGGRPQGP
jgi:hypothetical protein